MAEPYGYRRALERSNADLTRDDRPDTFTLGGREWHLHAGVFEPVYRPSTRVSLDFLGLDGVRDDGTAGDGTPGDGAPGGDEPENGTSENRPVPLRGRTFLEMGSGTGVVAVLAALAGCRSVVAADISPEAVRNTAHNAERHGVRDRVTAVRSDLFDALDPHARFDVVFWNSPFIPAPAGYAYRSLHERAFVDSGYAAHRRFLAEAPRRLTGGGSALLLFSSSKGDLPRLRGLAAECGRRLEVLCRRRVEDGSDMAEAEYLLIGITAAG
ncbi:methyltransferase [Streptomyces sp. ODS28]|uniref:methyltransferase n=1 Tax=Streptomyces sp. ODS28 TaxID=3136688 RepID=UPI0031E91FD9